MNNTKTTDLEQLTESTRTYLKSLGYGSRTIYMLNAIWRELQEYLLGLNIEAYEVVNGLDFLHHKINYPDILSGQLTADERDYIRAIRLINHYHEYGTIPLSLSRARTQWYLPIDELRKSFIDYCSKNLNSRSTKKSRLYASGRFMHMVLVDKKTAVAEITAKTISEYVATLAEYSKSTATVHLAGLRFFFTFLYEKGFIQTDLSLSIPRLHGGTGERISHILSSEQVKQLLNSIDRGSPIGKRNYAILLMAALLGMRESDITDLQFDNIDWEKSCISFFQRKTNRHLALPLLPVIGEAIIDYLKSGRPKTASKYIFVRHRPPFEKSTSFYAIMSVCLSNSGIKLKTNTNHGLHLASLGSTDTYTHIDMDGLFKCALDLHEVTAYEE